MIVITGAAGFIGSCIVARLNEIGMKDLILVDRIVGNDKTDGNVDLKKKNLDNKNYIKFYDKDEFIKLVENDQLKEPVEAIIHMGACSSTTLTDAAYFQKNNFEYSKILCSWSMKKNIRFIYASSAATYGDGSIGYKDNLETILKCRPLNLYGKSKQDFDEWIVENNYLDHVVGLKFFNVFGPNEYHKEDMRSVVAKAYHKVVEEGKMMLFKSHKSGYKDGEQKRDFIYVKDVVDVVLFFLDHHDVNGIYNVGTGKARTWNDLASALFSSVNKELNIEYSDMPETLRGKYQYFTQADMSRLKSVGYTKEFTPLEKAVKDYTKYLANNSYM